MVGVGREGAVARDALRDCGLFAGLDDASFDSSRRPSASRRFRRGEVIFHAGDPGDALFLVADGRVKITLPADDGSEPAILTTVGPGGFFGTLALLDGAPARRPRWRSIRSRRASSGARRSTGSSTRSQPCAEPCSRPSAPRSDG